MTEERLYLTMLHAIRISAQHVVQDALNVGRTARNVVSRYPFETEAEAAMSEAEAALVTGLDMIRQARAEYAAKPAKLDTTDTREIVELLSLEAAE